MRVQLPERAAYPTLREETPQQRALRAKVEQRASMLWRELEKFWGVRALRGRLWLQLSFQNGGLRRCVLRRAELRALAFPASRQKKLRHRLRRYLRVGGQQASLCQSLRRQPWPQAIGSKPIFVDVVLTRDK